ncbi:MAG: diguanylate cyclase response regulator [Elusimicrobia bacterium HGW-Elusimicrobia-3]|jgi:diguanylate cyclase (GGDEF)-like protein|nr:MAG: diguanylate cyclase response regulator [Elusimicrobia bacterium HGW-Elusimicrobia-3]
MAFPRGYMQTQKKILIVDDNPGILECLSLNFERRGFAVETASESSEALHKIHEEKPTLVILDIMLPGGDGVDVLKNIKENPDTATIPVMMLTAKCQISDKLASLKNGADDYVTKPFIIEELMLKAKNIIARSEAALTANPLTSLPGSPAIRERVSEILRSCRRFAFAYLDINYFKPYNDIYGYVKGDELIKFTADIIRRVLDIHGTKDDFTGHIGGDDFVFITGQDNVDAAARAVIAAFDAGVPRFYDEETREKKYVNTLNREGKIQRFPLVSVSIGVVTNEHGEFTHYGEVVEKAAEMKNYAKSFVAGESRYVKDKRRVTNY